MIDVKRIAKSLRSLIKGGKRAPKLASHEKPEGDTGIEVLGHRDYVGGKWEKVGKLQFDFLVSRGLRPEHRLLDIACGSLRAGVHFIPYLDKGNYLGIEKEQSLIDAGIKQELGEKLYREKTPEFVVSSEFEFHRFQATPRFALAQSLFTHLTPEVIKLCLRNLRDVMSDDGEFYATFVVCQTPRQNPEQSHDHDSFQYTREEIEAFGRETGWACEYIGDWGHPRDQMMVCYRPAQR